MFDPTKLDLACPAVAAALEGDPFYRSITEECGADAAGRRRVLERYFAYSIQEGSDLGRTVHLADRAHGVAVWLLPQPSEIEVRAAREKRSFLDSNLGAKGVANYYRMVEYMSGRAAAIVPDDAWYLSIIAVDPSLQGRGCGKQLLAPTLAEADALRVATYLETFGAHNVQFYERLGFTTRAAFDEPTTRARYVLMVRDRQPR